MTATWIDQPGMLVTPPTGGIVGLDTEFMRRNTYYPKLALLQAAHAGERWLLDPQAYDASQDALALTTGHTCVMHSAGEDLEALAPLLGDETLRLFDTQIAAAMCGMGPGLSYQKLVAALLDIDIPKDETRSDWLQRPLTASQLDYAEQDVAHLAALHASLTGQMQQRGRLDWHAEDCARLVQRAQRNRTQIDPQPQLGFSGAADWPPEAQARLRRILIWRETTARGLDKPKPWILDDAHALALAHQPPATVQDLFERVKGQRALRGPQRTDLFAQLCAQATPEELSDLPTIPASPRGAGKRAVDAMRQVVLAAAEMLDLPAGLLCPRRLIEEFIATRRWPDGLQGWRAGVLQSELTSMLPD